MMYLNSIFERFFSVLKDFDQSWELQKIEITHAPHIGSLCYLDSDKILL